MKFLNLFVPFLLVLLLIAGPSFASTDEMAAVLRRLDVLEQSNASIKQQNAEAAKCATARQDAAFRQQGLISIGGNSGVRNFQCQASTFSGLVVCLGLKIIL